MLFQLTHLTWTFRLHGQYFFAPLIRWNFLYFVMKQVIAGHIHARTGSSYIGMAVNVMHLLTSPLLLNQHLHLILWPLGGYVILLQALKESRWCEILCKKTVYSSTYPRSFCLFLSHISGHKKIIQQCFFFCLSYNTCSLKVQWVLDWFFGLNSLVSMSLKRIDKGLPTVNLV